MLRLRPDPWQLDQTADRPTGRPPQSWDALMGLSGSGRRIGMWVPAAGGLDIWWVQRCGEMSAGLDMVVAGAQRLVEAVMQ